MRQLIIIGTLLTVLLSCDNKDDLKSFITEDIKKYNDRITEWRTSGEIRTTDPILITRELFRYDDPERKTIIDFESKTVDRVTVTLTQEGLSDDSVDGEKRIIEFEKVNNSWTIKQIRLGFKCWKSRGHTNYSGQPCS
ncbi:MAG: hypothetical protein BroJett042_23800 [Bacteroidota bacterium]|nr:MAG: hypothetical protein BroJett042_23800 [Bacteroidota bacterium]